MKVELINAWDIFGDNNDGFIYGIQEVKENGEYGECYCEWFKTKKERDKVTSKPPIEVVE